MGAFARALSILPPPEQIPLLRDSKVRHLKPVPTPDSVRYHVVKHSMSGRGERSVVICDCWGAEGLGRIENLPERLPWYNETVGAIIDIERWSATENRWILCDDPRPLGD